MRTTAPRSRCWMMPTFMLVAACSAGDGRSKQGEPDGSVDAGGKTEAGTKLDSPLCRSEFPAHDCDGDPHGRWTLTAVCLNRYEGCRGAKVMVTGSAMATLALNDGRPEGQFDYEYDFDLETRLSVPASCLGGASCETIGCFAGDDPCSCVHGNGSGGGVSGSWKPNINGEVEVEYSGGSLRFCAGATTADSLIGGRRLIWQRVCSDAMDCRPSNPCHLGEARCAEDGISCEDTGTNRPVGTACGTDKVCDAAGECIPCAAGAECEVPNQPCKAGVISCATAEPRCMAREDRKDGSECGERKHCLKGACKTDDGAQCTLDSECKDACTCGDAQCLTSYCGQSCSCHYAPPAGACGAALDDGTRDQGACGKACFKGRCLSEIGDRCTRDAECGSGHCTCWLPGCNSGRLCSKSACPCQWASSGSETCSGPLMDGVGDLSCVSPQMCIGGACQ